MRDIFIADAHLLDPADSNYRRLLSFLEQQHGNTRTLYLLGDIFEFWVGFRHVVFAPYVPLLEALRSLHESGTTIVYVEGNHDFHMGAYFKQVLGCRILPDGGTIDLDGRKVYIGHGDLANPHDMSYRIYRKALRSLPLRLLMRISPPDLTWGIARWAGRLSRAHNSAAPPRRPPRDLILAHARPLLAKGHDAVITGHFHAPLFQSTPEGTIVSLGDWIDQYSFAVFEDGSFSLHTF
jgi:UDP-2,3-diacylglucosamine hydrolase